MSQRFIQVWKKVHCFNRSFFNKCVIIDLKFHSQYMSQLLIYMSHGLQSISLLLKCQIIEYCRNILDRTSSKFICLHPTADAGWVGEEGGGTLKHLFGDGDLNMSQYLY